MNNSIEKIKNIINKQGVYVALLLSLIALIVSLFNSVNLQNQIDRSIEQTVSVTKEKIAELEAASRLQISLRNLIDNKSYTVFNTSVKSIKNNLLETQKFSSSSDNQQIIKTFDDIIVASESKSTTTIQLTEMLIESLRTTN